MTNRPVSALIKFSSGDEGTNRAKLPLSLLRNIAIGDALRFRIDSSCGSSEYICIASAFSTSSSASPASNPAPATDFPRVEIDPRVFLSRSPPSAEPATIVIISVQSRIPVAKTLTVRAPWLSPQDLADVSLTTSLRTALALLLSQTVVPSRSGFISLSGNNQLDGAPLFHYRNNVIFISSCQIAPDPCTLQLIFSKRTRPSKSISCKRSLCFTYICIYVPSHSHIAGKVLEIIASDPQPPPPGFSVRIVPSTAILLQEASSRPSPAACPTTAHPSALITNDARSLQPSSESIRTSSPRTPSMDPYQETASVASSSSGVSRKSGSTAAARGKSGGGGAGPKSVFELDGPSRRKSGAVFSLLAADDAEATGSAEESEGESRQEVEVKTEKKKEKKTKSVVTAGAKTKKKAAKEREGEGEGLVLDELLRQRREEETATASASAAVLPTAAPTSPAPQPASTVPLPSPSEETSSNIVPTPRPAPRPLSSPAPTPAAPAPAPATTPSARARAAGLDGVITALLELVAWPQRYAREAAALGVQFPRGLLLHGPPGTGKSLAVRVVAEETGAQVMQELFFLLLSLSRDCLFVCLNRLLFIAFKFLLLI